MMDAEQLIVWIVGLILGAIEVPIFQWLKEKLGLEGSGALISVMVFSILIGFVALLATGGFSPFDMNMLFEYVASVIAMGQFVYGLFIKK
jgi:hypothetical protein